MQAEAHAVVLWSPRNLGFWGDLPNIECLDPQEGDAWGVLDVRGVNIAHAISLAETSDEISAEYLAGLKKIDTLAERAVVISQAIMRILSMHENLPS